MRKNIAEDVPRHTTSQADTEHENYPVAKLARVLGATARTKVEIPDRFVQSRLFAVIDGWRAKSSTSVTPAQTSRSSERTGWAAVYFRARARSDRAVCHREPRSAARSRET